MLKAGDYVTVAEGTYEDRFEQVFLISKDISEAEVTKRLQAVQVEDDEYYSFPSTAIDELVADGYLKQLNISHTIYLGAYEYEPELYINE